MKARSAVFVRLKGVKGTSDKQPVGEAGMGVRLYRRHAAWQAQITAQR